MAGLANLVDLLFSDFMLAEIIRTEDNLSKAKGRKEKDKLRNQAKGKKQVAAKQIVNMTSKSQTTVGGPQDLGVKKRARS